jgi:transposase InsO family protein
VGAPRIHSELLKLGIEVAQSTVAKYMIKRPRRPGQSWATFLRNHADGIAADLFVVPTIGFKLLYGLVILGHGRRRLIHYAVTAHPTSEWVARQIVEAFPWDQTPTYLVRDRDGVYGAVVKRRLRGLGIRNRPIAPASPWQNAYVERLIGSIRRDCIDHVIILGEAHLRRIMSRYAGYYNQARTHLASERTRRSAVRCSRSAGSSPNPWSPVSITATLESSFQHGQASYSRYPHPRPPARSEEFSCGRQFARKASGVACARLPAIRRRARPWPPSGSSP